MKNALADYRLFSWDQLRNYESLSRASSMLTFNSSTGRPTIRTFKQQGYSTPGSRGEPEWNPIMDEDRFRIHPVLLKLCYVMSYATERIANPQVASKPLALRFHIYPLEVVDWMNRPDDYRNAFRWHYYIWGETGKFLVTRHTLANAPPAERAVGQDIQNRYWNGSRELTAAQLRELATAIVCQVKKRGPFTSLAEFVNRRISSDTTLAVSGALQSALDDPAVSLNEPFRNDSLSGTEAVGSLKPVYPLPAAAKGPRRQGITGYVTQAD